MGYNTEFIGQFSFSEALTVQEIHYLEKILDIDLRDFPEFNKFNNSTIKSLTHVDFELSDDLDGLKWNDSECSYNMPEKINVITNYMREIIPDFKFLGEICAYGEERNDVWKLKIDKNGKAYRLDMKIEKTSSNTVICPCCKEIIHIKKENVHE